MNPPSNPFEVKKSIGLVGRSEYIKYFQDQYENLDQTEYSVLSLYGSGGIGKSKLISHLNGLVCENDNVFAFKHDFEEDGNRSFDFFNVLYKSLPKKLVGIRFRLAFEKYWSRVQNNIALNKNNRSIAPELTSLSEALEKLEDVELTDLFPGIAGLLIKHGKDKALEISLKRKIGEDLYNQISRLDTEELQSFPSILAYCLALDIKDYKQKYPETKVIFFFDTYEELYISSNKDKQSVQLWVTQFIEQLYKLSVMFVIAGHDEFTWKNTASKFIKSYLLGGLSHDDGDRILKNDIVDVEIRKMILSKFKGLPFYLERAMDLYRELENPTIEDFDNDTYEGIIERFLKGISEVERFPIEILSIPRSFDRGLIEYMFNKYSCNLTSKTIEKILNYTFFKKNKEDDTYRMHSLMRQSINITTERRNLTNNYLSDYYYNKIEKNNEILSKVDIRLLHEFVYHSLNNKDIDMKHFSLSFNFLINKYKDSGQLIQLSDVYNELINLCRNKLYKYTYMLELGLLYNNFDLNSMGKVIDDLNEESLPIELLDDLYFLEAKYNENLSDKVKTKKQKKDLLSISNRKYILIEHPLDLNKRIDISIGYSNILRKLSKFEKQNGKKQLLHKARNILLGLDNIIKKNKEQAVRRGELYYKLGLIYKDINNIEYDPINAFNYSLSIQKKYYKNNHLDIGKNYRQIGIISNDYKFILKALKIHLNYYNHQSSQITNIYIEFAKALAINNLDKNYTDHLDSFIDEEMLFLSLYKVYLKEDINNEYLNKFLSFAVDDEQKISSYLSLYGLLQEHHKKSDAIKYLYKIIFIYKKHRNYKELANIYLKLAYHLSKEESKEMCVIQYYNKVINLSKNYEDFKLLAKVYGVISVLNKKKGLVNEEKAYLIKQIHILEKYNLDGLEKAYVYLSTYYNRQHNFRASIKYLLLRIELIKDTTNLKYLDTAYSQLNKLAERNKYYNNVDEVEYYLKKALSYYKSINAGRYVDTTYGKLISYYESKNKNQKFNKEIEHLYFQQLSIRSNSENKIKYSKGYSHLAKFYLDIENYEQADKCYKKAIDISEEVGFYTNKNVILYSTVATIYAKSMHNTLQAEKYYNEAIRIAKHLKNNDLISQQYDHIIKHYMYSNKCKLMYKYILVQEKFGLLLNNKKIILSSYINFSLFYKKIGNIPKCEEYLLKSYFEYKELKYVDKQCKVLLDLGNLYKNEKNNKYFKELFLLATIEHSDGELYVKLSKRNLSKQLIIDTLEIEMKKIVANDKLDVNKFSKLIISMYLTDQSYIQNFISKVWLSIVEKNKELNLFSHWHQFKNYPKIQKSFEEVERSHIPI